MRGGRLPPSVRLTPCHVLHLRIHVAHKRSSEAQKLSQLTLAELGVGFLLQECVEDTETVSSTYGWRGRLSAPDLFALFWHLTEPENRISQRQSRT